MAAITVLLKVTVDENGDGEYGAFDPSSAPEDLAVWASDHLYDMTRKEHDYPWRVLNVELVRG